MSDNTQIKLVDSGIEIIDMYIGGSGDNRETCIKFYEKDLEIILEVFPPIVKGCGIKPSSKRNNRFFKGEYVNGCDWVGEVSIVDLR